MRARIIFRGLTLFTFERSTEGADPKTNLGKLTALLVSDPEHGDMPLHRHTPYLGFIGRDAGARTGPGRVATRIPITEDETTLRLIGHDGMPDHVTAHQSFLDYVPRLGALNPGPHGELDKKFITRRIVIPSGRIRTRDFISWDWHGNTPVKVAYMGTRFQGFGATEVVVDIGDDSDFNKPDPRKYLAVTARGLEENLWPYTRGSTLVDGIDPNTVEILITNLTARRRRPVFWGLHFQSLFRAAAYPPLDYTGSDQYRAFARYAREYDAFEWESDSSMTIDQPFPFIMRPESEKLPAIMEASEPYVMTKPIPAPAGRHQGDGKPEAGGQQAHGDAPHPGHMGSGGMTGTGMDPENSQICPFGRE